MLSGHLQQILIEDYESQTISKLPERRYPQTQRKTVFHLMTKSNNPDRSLMKEALQSKYMTEWIITMQKNFSELKKNQTRELVPCPSKRMAPPSKIILQTKRKTDGEVD